MSVEKRKPLTRRQVIEIVPGPVLEGASYGRWTVLRFDGRTASRNARYLCRCACGAERVVTDTTLKNGQSRSCGCLLRDVLSAQSLRHGGCTGGASSPEYKSWTSMRSRCSNPNDPSYPDYGARGIVVCDRWSSFLPFLSDMGPRPAEHSLERLDTNGPYEPSNCVWATPTQQNRNQRRTPRLTLNGVTRTSHEWSAITGLSARLIGVRKRMGWSDELALTRPALRGWRGAGCGR